MWSRRSGIMSIDVGSSAIRVSLLAEDGSVVVNRSGAAKSYHNSDEGTTLNSQHLWPRVAEAIRECAVGHEVLAIGVAAQLGAVFLDAAGLPIGPVRLWSDRTASSAVAEVRAAVATTGTKIGRRVTAELTGPRLVHLRRTSPEELFATRTVLSLKDYLVACLTGEFVTDHTHAGYSALYDVQQRGWDLNLIERLGLTADVLPPILAAEDLAGTVTTMASAECGLPEGVAVAVGGPDGTVGAVGAGAVRADSTIDIAGTTDVLVHSTSEPLLDPEGILISNVHPDGELWTAGGPTGMTGGALSWLSDVMRFPNVEAMNTSLRTELAEVPVGSRGLVVDTALTGHRFPFWSADRGGAVRGVTPAHGPADLVNAAHEGAAFLVGEGLNALRRAGMEITQVSVVGGAARRPESLALRASAWGLSVEGVEDGLATTRGAAALAAVASGRHTNLSEAVQVLRRRGTVYDPDAERIEALAEAARRWYELCHFPPGADD